MAPTQTKPALEGPDAKGVTHTSPGHSEATPWVRTSGSIFEALKARFIPGGADEEDEYEDEEDKKGSLTLPVTGPYFSRSPIHFQRLLRRPGPVEFRGLGQAGGPVAVPCGAVGCHNI